MNSTRAAPVTRPRTRPRARKLNSLAVTPSASRGWSSFAFARPSPGQRSCEPERRQLRRGPPRPRHDPPAVHAQRGRMVDSGRRRVGRSSVRARVLSDQGKARPAWPSSSPRNSSSSPSTPPGSSATSSARKRARSGRTAAATSTSPPKAGSRRATSCRATRTRSPRCARTSAPRPCERACRRGDIDRPLAIRAMKRFLVEWHEASGIPDVMPQITPREERVAVVGAGPAGHGRRARARDQGLPGHRLRQPAVRRRHDAHRRAGLPPAARGDRDGRPAGRAARRPVRLRHDDRRRHHLRRAPARLRLRSPSPPARWTRWPWTSRAPTSRASSTASTS